MSKLIISLMLSLSVLFTGLSVSYADEITTLKQPAQQEKHLVADKQNSMIFGVCSGIADYFGWDTTIVRVTFVVLTILTGGTWILVYLAMALLMN